MKGKILISILIAMITAGAAVSGMAQETEDGEVIDRVVVVVEDRALLQSELEMAYRQRLMQLQKESLPPDQEKELRARTLNDMVGNLLMVVHAEKSGIEVTDQQVEMSVERELEARIRAMGGVEVFNRELQRAGMTLDQLKAAYREDIRASLLIDEVRYSEVLKDIQVTEGEMKDFYRANLDNRDVLPRRDPGINLAQILIKMRASGEAEETALAKIRSIKKIVDGGADFAETAQEYSEGPSAKYGGSLGFMKLEEFGNPTFEAAARKLLVGEVSEPVLTEHGYHIIKLDEVSGDEVRLRHILVRRELDIEATKAFAEGIRKQILEGADFAEMAASYSEDPETKDSGGVITDIPMTRLPDFFQKAIAGVGDGEIAPLIEDSRGFRIIKILGRSEARVWTFEESRSYIKELIQRERVASKTDEYVAGLKEMYYVDVKIDI